MDGSMVQSPKRPQRLDWQFAIPAEDWAHYRRAIEALRAHRIRFVVGGGLAFSEYSGRIRNTKDLDLYVLPAERDRAIELLLRSGFVDYHEREPYDRSWIFRCYSGNVIVDLIWTAPNHRMEVDGRWMAGGHEIGVHGTTLQCVPPEELVWAKLFVMQRDRCDWPDLLNVMHHMGDRLDWRRLLARVGRDVALLSGLLSAFRWLSPERASGLPAWIWPALGLEPEAFPATAETLTQRAYALDTREWFGTLETLDDAP